MAAVAPTGPERTLAERAFQPFQQFAHKASAGGIVLLACTVLALFWANSPWAAGYDHLWEQPVTIGSPSFGLTLSLHHWINDGLMAVFFFVVGLEIKREFLVGELASARQAAFPMAGALGGMIGPALLYVSLNAGGPGSQGWGIPMATDIAFALGVLALLGSRVPPALKVFLAALAIVDDIGAVLVIALFYTGELSWAALGWAGAILGVLALGNGAGVRHPAPYALLGLGLWVAVLQSGVHATVAGVLVALTIPARTRIDPDQFRRSASRALEEFEKGSRPGETLLTNAAQQAALQDIERLSEAAQAPLLKLEDKLHGIVAFGIMPLFALANAGVRLEGPLGEVITDPISLGIMLGLVLGKPLGITLLAWLAVRLGLADRPAGASWLAVHAVSWLAGIGFTMSLFIAGLAFASEGPLLAAKVGVLGGSLAAGLVGAVLLRLAISRQRGAPAGT
ncbi:MAG TPA: Na+/H+ antiporter NhaA [Gemmatimonadales bacterium]|nr:Na+/H+ antiporter NhaA [Gemmatimonadales bacterium]